MAPSVYVVHPFGPRGKFGVVFCSGSATHIGVCIYTVLVLIPIQFIPANLAPHKHCGHTIMHIIIHNG